MSSDQENHALELKQQSSLQSCTIIGLVGINERKPIELKNAKNPKLE